jgi:hypothetical protein
VKRLALLALVLFIFAGASTKGVHKPETHYEPEQEWVCYHHNKEIKRFNLDTDDYYTKQLIALGCVPQAR